jgi:hypothetical protein
MLPLNLGRADGYEIAMACFTTMLISGKVPAIRSMPGQGVVTDEMLTMGPGHDKRTGWISTRVAGWLRAA